MAEDTFQEGTVPFPVPSIDTSCHTYYKIFGNLQSGNPALVVLHGGPGSGHEYCLAFRKLWSLYKIPVVFYDQIGCAKSTHLPHTKGDLSFWTMDLFADELENLVNHFGLNNSGYDLLGHSFGGKVVALFASRQPRGLRKLIIYGASADGEGFSRNLWELKKQLSKPAQQAIDEAVQKNDFTGAAYQSAQTEFMRTFLCRADPWPPEELAVDLKHQAEDNTVRQTMQGPSPWVYSGTLKTFSTIPILPKINVPTFLINGEFDTSQYATTAPFFNLIPRVRWFTIAGASHMAHLDSAELEQKTLKLVGEFLLPEENYLGS